MSEFASKDEFYLNRIRILRAEVATLQERIDALEAETGRLREKIAELNKPIACGNCGNTYEFVYIPPTDRSKG